MFERGLPGCFCFKIWLLIISINCLLFLWRIHKSYRKLTICAKTLSCDVTMTQQIKVVSPSYTTCYDIYHNKDMHWMDVPAPYLTFIWLWHTCIQLSVQKEHTHNFMQADICRTAFCVCGGEGWGELWVSLFLIIFCIFGMFYNKHIIYQLYS